VSDVKQIVAFVKTTVMGGFFLILPIAVIAILLGQVVAALAGVAQSLAQWSPVKSVWGVEVALLVAVALALLLCFLAGLVVRTALGGRAVARLERVVLERIPGYALVKNLTHRFVPGTQENVAFARLDTSGARSLVFVVEQLDDGGVVVFLPMAPTPTVGTVHVVRPEDLQHLDVSMTDAVGCLTQWGIGVRDLLRNGAGESAARESAR
jgi:uncharacterized membrane protein